MLGDLQAFCDMFSLVLCLYARVWGAYTVGGNGAVFSRVVSLVPRHSFGAYMSHCGKGCETEGFSYGSRFLMVDCTRLANHSDLQSVRGYLATLSDGLCRYNVDCTMPHGALTGTGRGQS